MFPYYLFSFCARPSALVFPISPLPFRYQFKADVACSPAKALMLEHMPYTQSRSPAHEARRMLADASPCWMLRSWLKITYLFSSEGEVSSMVKRSSSANSTCGEPLARERLFLRVLRVCVWNVLEHLSLGSEESAQCPL